jgi:hypothetical protein
MPAVQQQGCCREAGRVIEGVFLLLPAGLQLIVWQRNGGAIPEKSLGWEKPGSVVRAERKQHKIDN